MSPRPGGRSARGGGPPAGLAATLARADLPPAFERWRVVLPPGGERPTIAGAWAGALVLVERGAVEVTCRAGGTRTFVAGDLLALGWLPLRRLRNPGGVPARLLAVRRRRPLPEDPALEIVARGTRDGGTDRAVAASDLPDDGIEEVDMAGSRLIGAALAATLLAAGCAAADEDAEVMDIAAEADPGTVEAAPHAAEDMAEAPAPPPEEGQGAPDEVTFADHGVAGFVDTADLALSTFQTDADVASFRLAHAWLERRGALPPAEGIRAEEWVNAIDHRYPDPEPGETFRIVADAGSPWWHAPPGTPQETVLLRVGVQAAREVERAPAAITLVIDTSGSMSTDDRLGTVVDVINRFLDRLEPGDRVAVVEFNDEARLAVEHTENLDAVRAALDGLEPGGSTNTGAGVLLGHEQAVAAHRDGDNSTIVLLADGVANRGVTDPDAILDQLDGDAGIVLHTVGVGLEVYNDALLERLANASAGTYAYVDLPEQADRLFDRDLPVLDPVAHDVKAQVEFDPAAVHAWRLVGYENRLIDADDFRDDAVSGGYVGAGHAVTALYELVLDRESGTPAEALGSVTVRWADPRSEATEERTADLPAGLVTEEPASATFGTAAAMGALAEALRGSPHAVVNLDDVAGRLEATGDDQDGWLAGIVRAAAETGQVPSPDRSEVDPPGVGAGDEP